MKRYEDMDSMEMDVMREIGSIGTGNAATALSQVISSKIQMTIPQVEILGYNEAIKKMGGPESIVAGVLVKMTGEIEGLMLYIQRLDFINLVLEKLLSERITGYEQLGEMETSALVEIGNIMISSYINAVCELSGISINLSVPGISVNMLGGILSVPMIEFGHQTDKIMAINGKFICDNKEVYSNLLMMPDVNSLNYLLKKLGVSHE
jgi:chemotaxis protein CheC